MNPASLRPRIRAQILSVLASRGIEVHRTTGVRRTLPGVLAHYRQLGLAPEVVIDVGVGRGTPELYEAFRDSHLVLVEPLEEWTDALEQLRRERGADVILAAAGSKPGELDVTVHRVPALASMLGDRRGEPTGGIRRSVPVVTLDQIVRERKLRGPFVVKVDVEGAELEVLSGALEVLQETELALLEVSLFEAIPGMPQFYDVVSWMHDRGFVVADLYNGHNRPLDGALAVLDVGFVREDGRFRRDHAYGTADQVDALYRSWGY